jgi:hypothetical protein
MGPLAVSSRCADAHALPDAASADARCAACAHQAARFREQQAGQLEQLPLAGQEQHQESVETKLEQHVEHAAAKGVCALRDVQGFVLMGVHHLGCQHAPTHSPHHTPINSGA